MSCVLQLAQDATRALKHSHSFTSPSAQQLQGQHRSQREHLADHGVLKLLLSAVSNPWLLALCVMGVLLASASNTYVFFLPMIINALLHGEDKALACASAPGGRVLEMRSPFNCQPSGTSSLLGACSCKRPWTIPATGVLPSR